MKKTLAILLVLFFYPFALAQQKDSLGIMYRTYISDDPLLSVLYENAFNIHPASMLVSPLPSISTAAIEGLYSDASRALVPENGKGLLQGSFKANSFVRLSKTSSIDGGVQYSRAVKKSIYLNETADYDLLYPYVLADTLGGDMQHESYNFNGSWTHLENDFIYSIDGLYKATHEYRNIDPRPRDIASNLKIRGAIGCKKDNWSLLAYLGYRKYRQKQSVDFVSPIGANTTLFHATGLGHDYYRFRSTGVFASTLYSGQGFQSGIIFDGLIKSGIDYEYLSITRYLSNQNDAPITSLGINTLHSFVSYAPAEKIAMNINLDYCFRKGRENVIDCAVSGVYKNLLHLDMYSEHRFKGNLQVIYHNSDDTIRWSIKPDIGLYYSSENYIYPSSSKNHTLVFSGVEARLSTLRNDWLYDIRLSGLYAQSIKSKLNIYNMEEKIHKAYTDKYSVQMGDYALAQICASAQRALSSELALFIRLNVGRMSFGLENDLMNGCTLTLGITY